MISPQDLYDPDGLTVVRRVEVHDHMSLLVELPGGSLVATGWSSRDRVPCY